MLLSGGLIIALLAWVWLLSPRISAGAWWGLGSLLFPPLALVFAIRHAQKAISPLVIFALGSMLSAVPLVYSLLGPADLGLREQFRQEPAFITLAKNAIQSDAAHEWMESRAFYMQVGGVAAAVLAWSWLLIRAFRQHRVVGLWQFGDSAGRAFLCRPISA